MERRHRDKYGPVTTWNRSDYSKSLDGYCEPELKGGQAAQGPSLMPRLT
jgi:hypothetical protein